MSRAQPCLHRTPFVASIHHETPLSFVFLWIWISLWKHGNPPAHLSTRLPPRVRRAEPGPCPAQVRPGWHPLIRPSGRRSVWRRSVWLGLVWCNRLRRTVTARHAPLAAVCRFLVCLSVVVCLSSVCRLSAVCHVSRRLSLTAADSSLSGYYRSDSRHRDACPPSFLSPSPHLSSPHPPFPTLPRPRPASLSPAPPRRCNGRHDTSPATGIS